MKILANCFATAPDGNRVFLAAGTEAPAWAAKVISNPAVLVQVTNSDQDEDGQGAPAGSEEQSDNAGDSNGGDSDKESTGEADTHNEGADNGEQSQGSAADPEGAELRAKLEKLTNDELKDMLHEAGLSTSGNKADLIDRLVG